jgi:BirA family biotin operon repressor/biotin-[acetyl-CoA-carboxylase] ligase
MQPTTWQIEQYSEIDSTNRLAKEYARAGVSGRCAIVADLQTAGRGRMGRQWAMPAGAGLMVSLLLRPDLLAEAAYQLTMLAAVATSEAIEATASIPVAIKWPNDLLLAHGGRLRKVSGILTELDIDLRHYRLRWAVLGIGVNLTWHPTGVIDGRDLSERTTSLAAAGGAVTATTRETLLGALLQRVDHWCSLLTPQGSPPLQDAWQQRLALLGSEVAVQLPNQTLHGIAEGVDRQGALLLRSADGLLHTITAGDVLA